MFRYVWQWLKKKNQETKGGFGWGLVVGLGGFIGAVTGAGLLLYFLY